MNRQIVLCRYTYDPLDRLAACIPLAGTMARRFYMAGQLATEWQGTERRTYMHADSLLLAQKSQPASALLCVDPQNSVLSAMIVDEKVDSAYSPYGHREPAAFAGLPGFNGEHPDPLTGHYLLGNGYRAFNPVLMRFNSPDSLSPFADGGLNPYTYCLGDPINRVDPTGHLSWQAGLGWGFGVLGIMASVATLGAATPLAIAGMVTGLASGAAGVAQAATAKTNPEASSVLGWVGLGLGVASAGFGVAAGFQRMGNQVVERFKAGLSGRGAVVAGSSMKSPPTLQQLSIDTVIRHKVDFSGLPIRLQRQSKEFAHLNLMEYFSQTPRYRPKGPWLPAKPSSDTFSEAIYQDLRTHTAKYHSHLGPIEHIRNLAPAGRWLNGGVRKGVERYLYAARERQGALNRPHRLLSDLP